MFCFSSDGYPKSAALAVSQGLPSDACVRHDDNTTLLGTGAALAASAASAAPGPNNVLHELGDAKRPKTDALPAALNRGESEPLAPHPEFAATAVSSGEG